jgi:glycosyltransferase involved in cell wall biosynthesis
VKVVMSESTTAMGGQELAVLLQCQGLLKRGHEVRLVLEPGSPLYEKAVRQGMPVEAVSMTRRRYAQAILAFRRLLLRAQPDILHVNSSRDSWVGSLAARLVPDRPGVIRTRHISNPLKNSLTTRLLYRRLFDAVIVTGGELTRRGLVERDGLSEGRVHAFPIGIDVNEFRPGAPDRDLRAELGVDRTHRLVGIISYLRAYKGHEYFIEAAARVLARRRDVVFVIVGEGPLESALRELIAARGIGGGVRMLGFREDLLNVFRSLDVFVIPTVEADTIPQVLMQALAVGLPVVSTTVGSIPDVIADGETGFIVPPKDPGRLAERIERLLDDGGLAETVGRSGCRLVRECYSLDAMLAKLEGVYEKTRPGRPRD